MNVDKLRERFPITQQYNFQNHAAVAPISGPAAGALAGYAHELAGSAYLRGTYYRAAERVRQSTAELIHANPSEVTFTRNTSEGINLVAGGIQWVTGDNVVSVEMEFPANVLPWMNLESRGVTLRRVADEDGRVPFDRLVRSVDNRTRLVAISAVQWSNGCRTDLNRLGEFCKEKGILLFVDAIQALGVHPIDVRAMNIDFLAAGGHKWLLAPEGIGVFYCQRDLIGHLHPAQVGYMGLRDGYDVEITSLKPELFFDDARRFDTGSYNLAGVCALGASISLLLDVGIDQIQMRVKHLTDLLVDGVRAKGWTVHSPRTASEWSGIVSFSSERHDTDEIRRHLRKEFKIVVATRCNRLRASPHFYNSTDEIRQLVDALPGK